MLRKRVLRSVSRSERSSRFAGVRSADVFPISTSNVSSTPHDFTSLSASSEEGLPEASAFTPRKRRRTETRTDDVRHLPSATFSLDRPTVTHSTNPPLKRIRNSPVVALEQEAAAQSTPKEAISHPATSTSQLLSEACAHLIRVDPRLQPLIEKHHCSLFSPEGLAEVIK
ncbi:MAG: hypothetical protein LQ348_005051 [Seirophora lacunosa]|nr:MAG: hypothetical protein LQ344_007824 [Seirophora lacunosa]KAI4181221.1 MAG: hypothetical protein LQ348_005051 [Seirophora lacunosa]